MNSTKHHYPTGPIGTGPTGTGATGPTGILGNGDWILTGIKVVLLGSSDGAPPAGAWVAPDAVVAAAAAVVAAAAGGACGAALATTMTEIIAKIV